VLAVPAGRIDGSLRRPCRQKLLGRFLVARLPRLEGLGNVMCRQLVTSCIVEKFVDLQ
jgi:hypothetical protein